MDWAIEIKNFSKSFKERTAIKQASFRVTKGVIHGFIGPNGAGKTTTLKALVNLVVPTEGKLLIEGQLISDPGFKASVGYLPAEPLFPEWMSVEDFVSFCGWLRNIPFSQVNQRLRSSFLNRLRNQKCSTLSTGQKKLLQFFALDLYQPTVLILDEPLNGLDPTRRILTIQHLRQAQDKGATILISTHILSDLQELAQEITMIKRGQIVYSGAKTANIQETYREHFVQKGSNLFT